MRAFSIVILVIALFSYSCTRVNRKDFNSVGREVVKLVLSSDTNSIKTYLADSSTVDFNMVKEYLSTYKGQKYDIIKVDTTLFVPDSIKYVNVYYKIDTAFHRLEMLFENNKDGEIKIRQFWVDNMTKKCNEYLAKPFVPSKYGLQFTGINWTHGNNTLKRLSVSIRNAHMLDEFYELKFRLKVFVEGELVINRTFICEDKIYSGDQLDYEIKELRGLYAPRKMTPNNVTFEAEAIEALPKPKYDLCDELKDLRE